MPPKGIPYIDIKEFCDEGYLAEVNRRFFHPLGLALEVTEDDEDETKQHISGVWDLRDDPEGVYFDPTYPEKADRIDQLWEERAPARVAALGYMVQPVGPSEPPDHHPV